MATPAGLWWLIVQGRPDAWLVGLLRILRGPGAGDRMLAVKPSDLVSPMQ